ncbi:hypothetical protein PECL_1508 [Pediococcus claussenii ATCC BAA-344]|uniref:Uncharacterized protein n=1 Tax=Pediococcus claussenii (strain ATCC BAA-344 / DSM 14800 / JCM 18046 / KCTC 3811 / LMG 21948 / P06) TaxID=701521 RepID=G8PAE0_PEDCP|nr:hypothetical protein PECL_1508 [Pediococcus claussenii ATCC BAA-344]KRN20036.1 hypothetical protein IV79_GL000699 [Pediococcus claussenii]
MRITSSSSRVGFVAQNQDTRTLTIPMGKIRLIGTGNREQRFDGFSQGAVLG